MSFTYDIKTSQKDNQSMACLTISHLLFNVINLFLSTFLIAHIYSLTNDLFSYAINVGIYEISSYVMMLISYYLFSFLVDKTNRIWVYRVANILLTMLVIITIFFGKDLAKLIALAGCLYGLSKGAYYSSYNVLKQEMVSRKSMNNFVVITTALTKIVHVVCPILLGMLIDISTFSMVAVYVFILSLILITITFFIKAKRPSDSNFNVAYYLKRLNKNPDLKQKMKSIYVICFVYALSSIVSSLLSVSVMMHFGSNFSLGMVSGVCSLISILILFVMNKFTKFGNRVWLFYLATFCQIISAIIFTFIPNVITLIMMNFVFIVVDVICATAFDVIRNRNLKEAGFFQDIAEHQCIIETIFQISRITSYGLLIIVSLIKNLLLYKILFVIFSVTSFPIMCILLANYERKYKIEQSNLIAVNDGIKDEK